MNKNREFCSTDLRRTAQLSPVA